MGNGGGELDMAHALAAHLGPGYLNAAFFALDALVLNALIPAAVALPVLGGSENALAEETVALGLERSVVDGLGFFDFAVGPFADLFG